MREMANLNHKMALNCHTENAIYQQSVAVQAFSWPEAIVME
jgi:hypothetical protein